MYRVRLKLILVLAGGNGSRERKAPIIDEEIQATHKTKEQLRQEEAGLEEAIKLQAQLDEEAKLKRYGEELKTKTSKKQRIDDKDVPAIGEKVAEVKEEEQVKRTGKRKKQKARKEGVRNNRPEDAVMTEFFRVISGLCLNHSH
ncbi:hypothetical protein Tco_0657030 [Tanacetum coccineum]|uniref:Uncharacterized protein n=1 Tax=Tanacetum coccineum TaxID=301880 RepID=A0ABQ4XAF6_9ASTR